MTFLLSSVVVLAVLAAVVIIGAPIVERHLMYHPVGRRIDPAKYGLSNTRELLLDTPDGHTIVAWYAKAAPGQPTLLYFHGNSGTLADRADRIAAFTKLGRGILIMAYRGYSGSTGRPSESANVADAKLAYDTLIEMGVAAEDIILYGESIGTGIAVRVAAEKPMAGIILDAPYTSIVDVAEICYPYLPARLMMRDRYETMRYLDRVQAPLLVIHGEQDTIIPVEMGRKVARSAPGPAEIVTFRRAGHTDHAKYGSFEVTNDWIDRVALRPMVAGQEDRAAG
jgi:fermentation-respiration switch protein FrsA (DUF1100 family)